MTSDAAVAMRVQTFSLLTAMTIPLSVGCGPHEPTEPAVGAEGESDVEYAPSAVASPEFLNNYAATYRYRLGQPRAVRILPDGGGVLFLRSGGRSFDGRLHHFDLERREERELMAADQLLAGATEELSEEEAARRERMRLTARGIASFRISPDGETILVPLSGRLFLIDRDRASEPGAVRELESDAGPAVDPRFSPDGRHIATVRRGDLYVIDVSTGAEARLTTRPSDAVENGSAEFVAQEEMGRMRGFWWSPDSTKIVYQQTDHTGMESMHLLDPTHPERAPRAWPYPRPGHDNARVRLGVIGIGGGATRWIDWDHDRYPYLASVRWPRRGPLTLLVQDREQHREQLLAVEEESWTLRELLTEEDDAWLNLDQSVPRWLQDGERFLWSSERGGAWQLELRAADGSLVRTLTAPELGYRSLLGVDEEAGTAWVSASDDPTQGHIFTVPLDGDGDPVARTDVPGQHSATVRENVWVRVRRRAEGGVDTTVMRGEQELGVLRSEAEEPPFEPRLTFEEVGERNWNAVIVRPRDFDPSLRYPVILHVYGGPHARYVTQTPQRYLLSQWHADHNFIVVSIDGRGTPGRGREWERAIDEDLMTVPLEDQVTALQALGEAHPEMDMERVGVWGWSFGGYFSAMAALRRPDVFRAAVAGAPVSEWRDYDTHYTERYLGLPEAEGEDGAYDRSSVLTYATEAPASDHRPLLIIHGTADDNVYFSHALKLQNRLFRAGRPAELLALSGLTHMVPEPTVMRRMHQRVIGFFETHLRRPSD